MKKISSVAIVLILMTVVFFANSCNDTEKGKATVSFDANGGSNVQIQEIEIGSMAKKPENPTKTGYEFHGWYLKDEEWSFSENKVTDDIELKAKWVPVAYDIVYVGLSENSYPTTYTIEDIIVLETYSIDKYTEIEGWYLDPDFKTQIAKIEGMSSDLTIYAKLETVTSVFDIHKIDGGYEIAGRVCNIKDVYIPSTYNSEPIISIGAQVFFSDTHLESITIPDSVKTIGELAFSDCSSLASVILPNGLTSIAERAFQNCTSLESIVIPDSITTIENEVFQRCSSLKNVEIPSGVTSIGFSAFSGCSSLTSISIPDSVTEIKKDSFSGCVSLKYNEYDNAYYFGNEKNPYKWLVKAKDKNITSCKIHEDTRVILSEAFAACQSLESINIPNGITEICSMAFYLSSVKSVTVPESITVIEETTFYGCSLLEEISLPKTLTQIRNYAFYECASLKKIIIPNSVIEIGTGVFKDCSSLAYNEYESAYYLGNEENPYLWLMMTDSDDISTVKVHEDTKFIHKDATLKLQQG